MKTFEVIVDCAQVSRLVLALPSVDVQVLVRFEGSSRNGNIVGKELRASLFVGEPVRLCDQNGVDGSGEEGLIASLLDSDRSVEFSSCFDSCYFRKRVQTGFAQ